MMAQTNAPGSAEKKPGISLEAIAAGVGGQIVGDPSMVVTGITHDSRQVESGWLFACIRGATVDGHNFAATAVQAGAGALLVDHVVDVAVPQIMVDDVRAATGLAAAKVYGDPSTKLTVVGVTGTNGKTTIVEMLAAVWTQAGRSAKVIGTLTGPRTTPEGPDLHRQLAQWSDEGVELVAIEVSSHSLELARVAGVQFACVAFTNLGRDHLDFHHDMESYFAAKAKLFAPAFSSRAVINRDDPFGQRLYEQVAAGQEHEAVAYGLDDAYDGDYGAEGSQFTWQGQQISLRSPGLHNVSNALAAANIAAMLGLSPEMVARGLSAAGPVRGRFEIVPGDQPFTVAVDYAHTPDALAAVLATGREVSQGRVIVVFGCGGDRDREKRPEMGRVAAENAEVVVVTSDNPRSEDPRTIVEEILVGVHEAVASQKRVPESSRQKPVAEVKVDLDREKAITWAVAAAQAGDLVVIAGKGHETTQVTGSTESRFDDAEVATAALANVKANV